MADSAVAITAGSGTSIDTRTEATNGNHRQVVVLGDPSTNAGVAPVDATNGLSVTLTTALPAGSAAIGKLAANSGVDIGDVDVTTVGTITPGTAATSLGKAEDAAHSSGDVGVMALSVRQDTAAATSGTDGDYQPLITDGSGRLHVNGSGVTQPVSYATTGSGTATGALRVELPTNGTGVIATVGAVTAITNALPAGTNAIGKLSSNSGVVIGDVNVVANVLPAGAGSVGANRKVVTTAGTAVQLATASCKYMYITAETDNTGLIAIGDSTVVAAEGSQKGLILFAGAGTGRLEVSNTNLLYIDSTVSGDGITYAYFN